MNTSLLFSLIAILVAVVAIGNTELKNEQYDDAELKLIVTNLDVKLQEIDATVTSLDEYVSARTAYIDNFYNFTMGKIADSERRLAVLEKPIMIPPPPKPPAPAPTPEPKGKCSANFQMAVVDLNGFMLAKETLSTTAPVFIKGTFTDIYKQVEYTVSNSDGEIKAHQFSQVDSKNEFRLAFNILTNMPAGKYSTEVLIQGQSDCIDFTLE